MATERSDKAYGYWRDASEKFDYFVLGLTGALAAFIGQSYKPSRLGLNASAVELLALALIVLAAIFGFKRVEANVTLLREQTKRLYGEESRGSLLSAATTGSPALNTSTGDVLSSGQLLELAEVHQRGVAKLRQTIEQLNERSAFYYHWRNRALLAGFAVLVAGKLVSAYAT